MKNIIFTLSLLTIVSANILYPMERPTNVNRQADSQDLVYKCPSHTCNKMFALKSDLNTHVQQKHTLNGMTMLSGFESEEGYNVNNHMDVEKPSHRYFENTMHFSDPVTEEEENIDNTDFSDHFYIAELLTKMRQPNNNNNNNGSEYNASITIRAPHTQPQAPCKIPRALNQEICTSDISGEEEYSSDSESNIPLDHPLLKKTIAQHAANTIGEKVPCPYKGCNALCFPLNISKHISSHKKVLCPYEGCHTLCFPLNLPRHIRSHTHTHTEKRSFACKTCNRPFTYKSSLTRHMLKCTGKTHTHTHTKERPFSCETCNLSFTHKSNLNRHMKIHTGIRPFTCEICHHPFALKWNLQLHMRTHTSNNMTMPSGCGSEKDHNVNNSMNVEEPSHSYFDNTIHLADPVPEEEENEENIDKTDFFGNVNISNLLTNIQQTKNNNNNNNNSTGYNASTTRAPHAQSQISCRTPHMLNQEIYISSTSGEEEYSSDSEDNIPLKHSLMEKTITQHAAANAILKKAPCTFEECNTSCFSLNLPKHIHTDTEKRFFTCKTCDRPFRQKSSLDRHMLKCTGKTHTYTHTKERPFSCETCHKSFKQKTHLSNHMLTHKGVKPFTCETCNVPFTLKWNLDAHIRRKHTSNNMAAPSGGEPEKDYGVNNSMNIEEPSHRYCDNTIHLADPVPEEEEREEENEENINKTDFFGNVNISNSLTNMQQTKNNNNNNNRGEYNAPTTKAPHAQSQIPCRIPHRLNQEIYISSTSGEEEYSSDSEDNIPLKHSLMEKTITQHAAANAILKKAPCTFEECDTSCFSLNLPKHIHTDTEKRFFTCKTCDRPFRQKSSLDRHMLTCTGKTHTYTHTKERPFSCETCNKSFTKISNLTRHINIHTEAKPFTCEACNIPFTLKENLNAHIRRKHTSNNMAMPSGF